MNDFLHAFPGQEEHEPVYVFARPYPVAFLPVALVFLLVFLFTVIGELALINGVFGALGPDQVNGGILFLGAFQIFIFTVFLAAVLDFYYDIVIVTDRRLVDINQDMMFFRRISSLSLTDVEDVASTVKGLLPTMFEYGTVEVQTAGARDNFEMSDVRYPREITAIVQDLADQAKEGLPESQRIPQTGAVAVIDSQRITTVEQLSAVGAMLPDDFRRTPRNAPQPIPVQPSP